MFQRLFFSALFLLLLLLLSLFCCTNCEAIADAAAATAPQSIEIFSLGKTMIDNGTSGKIIFTNFYLPFLVATDNALVAVAGGLRNTDTLETIKFDILTKYIDTKEKEWVKKINNDNDWKTEYAPKQMVRNIKEKKLLAGATNKNNIYILLVNDSVQLEESKSEQKWEFVLFKAELEHVQKVSPNIKWEITPLTNLFEKNALKEELLKKNPQIFSEFVTTEGKVVFFVSGGIQQNNKTIFAIIKSNDSQQNLKVLPVVNISQNCNPHFILWGEKIIMIPNNCNGNQKTQKFDYTNEDKLEKSNESVGRVWEFLENKNDITTATISNTSVVLFTQEKIKSPQKKDIFLWVTDGNRSANVGIVFPEVDNNFYRSFVCRDNHLFSLHQKSGKISGTVYNIKYLSEHMESITSVLNSWKEGNEKLTQLCQKTNSINILCSTDGLVGFLSGKGNNSNWQDEYNYVNATVTEGTKINGDGFNFAGKNKGAKWPVGKTAEDQPYNFADFGFTLVATVKIDKTANDIHNSILGADLKDIKKSIGLLCTKEATWGVYNRHDNSGEIANKEPKKKMCVANRQYQVALVYNKNKISVYVNWKIIDERQFEMNKADQDKLQFYFGNDGTQKNDVESHVTITNVLLYNRPFTTEEIDTLKPKEEEEEETHETQKTRNEESDKHTSVENINEIAGSTDTLNNQTDINKTINKEQILSHLGDGAARVAVDVMSFMFFGVFTLLGRYVCV